MRKNTSWPCLLLLLLLPGTNSRGAETLVVSPDGTGEFTEIQAALSAAGDGDEIIVEPGTYTLARPLDFEGKSVELRSRAGAEKTRIEVGSAVLDSDRSSVVIFENGEGPSALLEGFTLSGGRGSRWKKGPFGSRGGGALLLTAGSSPTIVNCHVTGNDAQIGGGILSLGSARPVFRDCTIRANTASVLGGGVALLDSSPVFEGCRIEENSVESGALRAGGGIYGFIASPVLRDCRVSRNRVELTGEIGQGGGGYFEFQSAPEIQGSTFELNVAHRGGGLAFFESCSPRITSSTFARNWSRGGGGLFLNLDCPATISRCEFRSNVAAGEAGGGGILMASIPDATVRRCRITGNQADHGGAIQMFRSTPRLENCLIVLNASRFGTGGIDLAESSRPVLVHLTVSDNTSTPGRNGGIHCDRSSARIHDSIVADVDPESYCGETTGSIVGVDPRFVERGAHDPENFEVVEIGGEEFELPDSILAEGDYHLREDSPAIGIGELRPVLDDDLEGRDRRRCKTTRDAGALALCDLDSRQSWFRRGDTDGSGVLDISDPVHGLRFQFLGGPWPTCARAHDFDGNGEIELTDPIASLYYQFLGGPPPPAPGPHHCGPDPDPGELTCEDEPACSL